MSFGKQLLKKIRYKAAKALYNKKNKKYATFPSEVKKIFVIGWEYKIGDYIVSAFFFRELKKIFPKAEVILLASGSHKLPSYHESIDQVIYCDRRKILQFMGLKKKIKKIGNIDICVAVTTFSPQEASALSMVNPKYTYALTSSERKSFNLYDHYIPREGHYSSWFMYVLRRLGEGKGISFNDKYEIKVPQKYVEPFYTLSQNLKGKNIVTINPFGTFQNRRFSCESVMKILQVLKKELSEYSVILLAPSGELEKLLSYDFGKGVVIPQHVTNIEHSLAIIRNSSLLISPDTFAVHTASNYGVKQIAVYLQSEQNFIEWSPNSNKAKVVFADEKVDNVDFNQLEAAIRKFRDE